MLNATLYTQDTLMRLLADMERALRAYLNRQSIAQPLMVGIHTGGVWIARHLHERLGLTEPLGALDITFYRDDFSRIGLQPRVRPSRLPLSIDERHVILIDDVLFTGRTVRAALNELFDYGRPASVTLGVLIEREGRELPIAALIIGERLALKSHQHIKLTGPEPLALMLTDTLASSSSTPP